ncbi:hypothetical protein JCM8097_002535 [Rhodosporidiobolus ruineniae]
MSPTYGNVLANAGHGTGNYSAASSTVQAAVVAETASAAVTAAATMAAAYSGHGGGGGGNSHGGTTTTGGTYKATGGKAGKARFLPLSRRRCSELTELIFGPQIAIAQSDQRYAKYYQYAFAGVVGLFFLRNIVLTLARAYDRRQQRVARAKKGVKAMNLHVQKPVILRAMDKIDSFFLQPCTLFGWFPSDYTRIRVLLNIIIFTITIVFCFVDGPMTVMAATGFDTAAAFSFRTGMIATACYPMVFLLYGRGSVVSFFTGLDYLELRYWHIVFGFYAFWLSLIHTVAYVAHYYMYSTGAKALAQAAKQQYFYWGIIALVFMGTNYLIGLKWVRRRGYELFLLSHIAGAVLIIVGSWYHRPSMIPYAWAAAGIWIFERTCRFVLHLSHVAHYKLYLRRPVHRATATVVDGAIKMNVPIKGGQWGAGQHYYISFWGLDLLRRPWLYGQVHPFSTANVSSPSSSSKDTQEIRFLLRVHGGLAKDLANHIMKRSEANGGKAIEMLVTLEGPYGSSEDASEFDSVLLVAGGSGITHPLSTFHELAHQAVEGKAVTSNVKLVWAVQKQEQAEWASETLAECRALASQAGLAHSVDLHITRPSSSSSSTGLTPSTSASGSSTPSTDIDEKEKEGSMFSDEVELFGGKTGRFFGRPDVQMEVRKAIAESAGRTLVCVCGPTAIADDVRKATAGYPRSQVVMEVATFEC